MGRSRLESSMRPFQQQLAWTALAFAVYASTFLVPGLEKAVWLQNAAMLVFGAMWVPRPQEMAAKREAARLSGAPPP